MLLLTSIVLLLGCTSFAFADGHADSKGCCEYKRVPGSMPKSGDYFLMEHRNGVPDYCKDGCVYLKESSGSEEYCFMPSSTYTAECQDNGDDGQQAVELPDNHGSGDHELTTTTTMGSHDNHEGGKVECDFSNVNDVDGQLYTIDDVETNEAGILKFEFDQNVIINVRLVEEPDITFDCTNGICTSNVAVDAGDWTVEVKNGFYGDDGTFSNGMFEDEKWDSLPLIKTYFVDDKNYCEGEEGTSDDHSDMDHGDMDHDDMDHGDMDHDDMAHGTTDHGGMDHSDTHHGVTDDSDMDHDDMDHGGMDHSVTDHGNMDHSDMDHGDMDNADMDHGDMDHGDGDMDHGDMDHGDMDHSDMDHSNMDHNRKK